MAALARRLISILTITTLVVVAMAPAASAASHENEVLALLNAARTANGLTPVTMHSDLVDDARSWTQHMREQGQLSHNPNLAAVTTRWDKLGENVGVGPTAELLHEAFMASPGHRGNVLGDYDYVGIAVVEEHATKLWVTVVFMKSLDPPPATQSSDGDPVPYAEVQPKPAAEAPVAATRATRTAPPAPAVPHIIPYARVGGWIFAI